MRDIVIAAIVGLGLGIMATGCGSPACQTDNECGAGNVCLPSRSCAKQCVDSKSCGGTETCNSGGCVAPGVCASNYDCKVGQTCTQGACIGQSTCGAERLESKPVQANMLVVLDHSGSMMERIGSTPKWTSAIGAVRSITSANPHIRFGLQLFSNAQAVCDPGKVSVAVQDDAASLISNALPVSADGRNTPIAAALKVAGADPGLNDAVRANYVLLITDGKENCNGNPVQEVQKLFTAGQRTYTVGFGGAVDNARLNDMAIRGGTARMDARRYYQADNQAELAQALATIARGAAGCDFALTKTPSDLAKVFVGINGQLVPRDPGHLSGWDYAATGNRLTFYGPACDVIATDPQARIDILYGCADPTLIEAVPPQDGGYDFTLDAGVPYDDGGVKIN